MQVKSSQRYNQPDQVESFVQGFWVNDVKRFWAAAVNRQNFKVTSITF